MEVCSYLTLFSHLPSIHAAGQCGTNLQAVCPCGTVNSNVPQCPNGCTCISNTCCTGQTGVVPGPVPLPVPAPNPFPVPPIPVPAPNPFPVPPIPVPPPNPFPVPPIPVPVPTIPRRHHCAGGIENRLLYSRYPSTSDTDADNIATAHVSQWCRTAFCLLDARTLSIDALLQHSDISGHLLPSAIMSRRYGRESALFNPRTQERNRHTVATPAPTHVL